MNCDECREAIVRGERVAEADEHAARCAECGVWLERESEVMTALGRAGRAWREAPLEVTLPAAAVNRAGVAGRIARFAAAAAVLAVAAGGIYIAARPTPASAMQVMVRELRERGNVRFVMSAPFLPGDAVTMYVSGDRMRIDLGSRGVVVTDASTKRTAFLMPATRSIMSGDNPGPGFDLYGMLIGLADSPRVEELGAEAMEGRAAEKFRVQLPPSENALPEAIAVVWVDVVTRLPLRVEIPVRATEGEGTVVFREFAFDEVMSEEIFDTDPPGYTAFAPGPATPAIGTQMRLNIRNVGMAFHMYMQEHDGAVPERIEELAPYLAAGGLKSLRRPEEEIGYVYVKPKLPLEYEDVVLYERFAEGDDVLIVRVDSRVEIKTRAEVEEMARRAEGRR